MKKTKKIEIPVISMDQVMLAGKILVLAAINKGATGLTLHQDDFKDKDGNNLGSYKITVKRKK